MFSFTGSCSGACLLSAKDSLIFVSGQLSLNTRQRTCFLNSNKCSCKLGYFWTNFSKSNTGLTIPLIKYHTSMYGSALVKNLSLSDVRFPFVERMPKLVCLYVADRKTLSLSCQQPFENIRHRWGYRHQVTKIWFVTVVAISFTRVSIQLSDTIFIVNGVLSFLNVRCLWR